MTLGIFLLYGPRGGSHRGLGPFEELVGDEGIHHLLPTTLSVEPNHLLQVHDLYWRSRLVVRIKAIEKDDLIGWW